MLYAASPHITLWASPESVLVVFSFFFNKKHKPLSLFLPTCSAEEELDYVDTEGPVLCWDSLGLPDLDCDEKPGWISSSSLAGELIQPGPQEVWTKPTHQQTLLQCVEFRETRKKDWMRDIGGNITEEGRKRTCDSQRHCMLRWEGRKTFDGLSWDERRGKREQLQTESKVRWREKKRAKEMFLKDRNCIPLKGRLL